MSDTKHENQQNIEPVLEGEHRSDEAPLRDFGPVNLRSEPMSKKKKMVMAAFGAVALVGATFAMGVFDFKSHPKPEVSLSPHAPTPIEPQALSSERVKMTSQEREADSSTANTPDPNPSQALVGISTKPIELTAAQIATATTTASHSNEEVLSKVGEVLDAMKELKEEVKVLRAQVRRTEVSSSKSKAEPVAKSDLIAITVVEVSPTLLTLMSEGKKVTLRIGEKMPGGAVFLGFDQTARKLRTDQGDFAIPS